MSTAQLPGRSRCTTDERTCPPLALKEPTKPTPPGAAVLDALEAKYGQLLGNMVVTRDMTTMRILHKQEREADHVRWVVFRHCSVRVLVCGDQNITHHEIDANNWKANQKRAGFQDQSRAGSRIELWCAWFRRNH